MKESKAKDQACARNKNIKLFSKTKQAKPKYLQNQNGGILKFYEYFKGVVGVPTQKNILALLFIFKI